MKKLLFCVSGIAVVAVIGLIALPSLVPSSVYKDKIESQLSQELDRDVRVLGDIKLSVFPVIRANAGRVEIDNPDGFEAEQFASMDAMSARVKLIPLFSKRVQITSFTLKNPTISLEKNSNGAMNWAFGDETPAREPSETGPFKRDGRFKSVTPSIGKFALESGTINYSDKVAGRTHNLTDVNIDFALSSLSAPLDIDGNLIYNGTPADIDLSLNSMRDFLDGKEAPVSFALKTDFADISSKGKFLEGEDIRFDLDVDGDVSNVAKLVKFSPVKVPYAELANAVKISGNYVYDGKILTAKNADIMLSGSNFDAGFTGRATLSEPPIFDGRVTLDADDVKSLAKSLKQDIKGLDLIKTAKVSADFKAQGKGFAANNINADIKGDGLSATYSGSAVIADTVTATGAFTAKAAALPTLIKSLDMDIPQAKAAQNLDAKGNLSYTEDAITLSGLDVKTSGGAVNGSYTGGAVISESKSAQGEFSVDTTSVPNLVKLLELDVPQAAALQSLNAKGSLNYTEDAITLSGLDVKTSGGAVNGSYSGGAVISETKSAQGAFTVDTASVPNLVKLLELDIPQAAALQSLNAKGSLNYAGDVISVNGLDVKSNGGAVSGSYNGDVKITDKTPNANGQFLVDIPSVAKANKVANLKIDAANAVGSLKASGGLNLAGKNISFTGLDATTAGDLINGHYAGTARIGDVTGYDGHFTTTLTSLGEMSKRANIEIPYSNAIGTINVEGNISGQGETLKFHTLNASLSDGQLNGKFTGAASLNNGLSLDGDLSADIPSLRNLSQSTGKNILPPSTSSGPIYERFSASGKVKGNPAEITFNSADIQLDALRGTGDFAINMRKAKPYMSGRLNMNDLDIRPYMAAYTAQKPTGAIQPWSEAPINVSPLRAFDGDFTLSSPNIVTDRMSLGQTQMSAKLSNGVMTADMPNLVMYGGIGRMKAVLNGSNSVPSIYLDMGLDRLDTDSFLAAAAGFTNATGELGSLFKLEGRGRTQAEIMRSLTGRGDFKMLNGKIAGVDLPTLLTGIDQALSSRSLPSGIGPSYSTTFSDILGLFTITNGVANINKFSLGGPGVLAEGTGNIDIGNQQIDFSIRPRLTGKSANELGSFGIPIRVQGRFGNVKVGLDDRLIGQIVAERARAKAASLITNQVGGDLGNIIGGVVGGQQSSQRGGVGSILGGVVGDNQQSTQNDGIGNILSGVIGGSQQPSQSGGIESILGGVLGGTQPTPTQQQQKQPEQPAEPKKKEPSIEDVLGGLFGGK